MLSADIIKLLYALLPGFFAAWIFFGLTAHPRKDMFERAVQALIFSALVQAVVLPFRKVSQWFHWGPWSEESKLVLSLGIAALIGFVFSGFANNNTFHDWLSKRQLNPFKKHPENAKDCWRWTKRTSFPSEWYSTFNRDARSIILYLKGSRRLKGWPFEWPDSSDHGHFVIDEPAWILDDNEQVPLLLTKRLLIPVTEIEMVEVLRDPLEIHATEQQIQRTVEIMIANNKENENGEQSATT